MPHNVPVETSLGRLFGRDCIYLDSITSENSATTVVLEGSINGNLCTLKQPDDFIPYTLWFRGVHSLKMVDLDSCDWPRKSSFDEIQDSELVRILGDELAPQFRHFSVSTYDYVFEIVCMTYEFGILRADA